ncbi:hypothetical protein, partial [Dickeya chrysanthemi]|uniref:hypothetical protein n=1 Tax=Dickeya chrysanthemi TaxID=556 RepID=UPI001C8DFC86
MHPLLKKICNSLIYAVNLHKNPARKVWGPIWAVSVKVVGTPGLFRLPVFPVLDSALPCLPDASF